MLKRAEDEDLGVMDAYIPVTGHIFQKPILDIEALAASPQFEQTSQ